MSRKVAWTRDWADRDCAERYAALVSGPVLLATVLRAGTPDRPWRVRVEER